MSLYGRLNTEKVVKEYVGLKTDSAFTRVDNINNTIKVDLNKEFAKNFIKDINFNEETGVLTFTKEDNSTIEIDLPTEKSGGTFTIEEGF